MPIALKASRLPLPTRIAFVGNYLPRECGIATFTTDLCNALAAEYGEGRLFAIPVNDPDSSYDYPEQVRLELTQEDIASYERAADFLNFNSNDLVCLQHEYGIYGGAAGRYILALLRRLKMPLVTTLHTVLREPDANQRIVLEEIAQLSDRLVVMSELAAQLLREVYAVPGGKIDVIPHGVPDMPFMDPNYFKDRFGTEGKSVLLTFGLLSPNKGIENVIRALPAILARHPNVVYIVSGVTHPHIRRREGERYREELQALAARAWRFFPFDSEQSLREYGRACGARRRGRYLHHALPAGGADCLRHAGHRAGSRQGNYLHALLARQGIARGQARRDCPVRESGCHCGSGYRITGERCGAPRHAQARLSALPRNHLAEDGAGLHGDLSAGALRALVAAQGRPTGRCRS